MDTTIAILNRIAAAEHADPASDDLTIPLAIENADLAAEIGRLRTALRGMEDRMADAHELVPFLAVHADCFQRERGLNGLHPTHYDLMQKHGVRMDSFTRATNAHDGRKPGETDER